MKLEKTRNEWRLCVEEKQDKLAERRLELDERKLTFDGKRLALEVEDKKSSLQDRKQISGVLTVLSKKLG